MHTHTWRDRKQTSACTHARAHTHTKGENTDKCLHTRTCTHTHEGLENRQAPAHTHAHTHSYLYPPVTYTLQRTGNLKNNWLKPSGAKCLKITFQALQKTEWAFGVMSTFGLCLLNKADTPVITLVTVRAAHSQLSYSGEDPGGGASALLYFLVVLLIKTAWEKMWAVTMLNPKFPEHNFQKCSFLTQCATWQISCSLWSQWRCQIHLWHKSPPHVRGAEAELVSQEWMRCPPGYLPVRATAGGSPVHPAQTCRLLWCIWHPRRGEADSWWPAEGLSPHPESYLDTDTKQMYGAGIKWQRVPF